MANFKLAPKSFLSGLLRAGWVMLVLVLPYDVCKNHLGLQLCFLTLKNVFPKLKMGFVDPLGFQIYLNARYFENSYF